MKTGRTYVFMFVPILIERVAQTKVANGFCAESNGSLSPDKKYDDRPRWRVPGGEKHALPYHLFWTWFVDNPHPSSKSS
jgi:hypothetical protein